MRPARIILGTKEKEAQSTRTLTDRQVQEQTQQVHIATRIAQRRLTYLPRVLNAGPTPLLALMQTTPAWSQQA
eukprot:13679059-Alexandrium_andersonii.AAC.1